MLDEHAWKKGLADHLINLLTHKMHIFLQHIEYDSSDSLLKGLCVNFRKLDYRLYCDHGTRI